LYGACSEARDATEAFLADCSAENADVGLNVAYLSHASGILDGIFSMCDAGVSLPTLDLEAPEPLAPGVDVESGAEYEDEESEVCVGGG
jgi:hypothetical protein